MASCEANLRKAVRAVEPTSRQKEGAVRSHNFLQEKLKQGSFGDRIIGSYLSGSYARDTAIAPLDDVDIIFLIDASCWSSPFLSSRPKPDDLLKSFARAVKYRYPDSSVRLQRRSICLKLNHIHLDVVPAMKSGNDGTLIEIPDRQAEKWIRTNPRAHSEYSSRVNLANENRLKPLVKLLKYWNSVLPSTARLKSFAIETLVTRLFEHERITSLQEGLLRFFDFIAYLAGGSAHFMWNSRYGISLKYPIMLTDASGISNLLINVERGRVDRFVAQATKSRNCMLEAYEAARDSTAWKRTASALRFPD